MSWKGVPLTEIFGSQTPWGAPEFPLVAPAYNHAVLYHISNNGELPGDRPPKPQIGQDKWDHDFVRMPCSSHSLYPVDNNGEKHLKKRWEIIENTLWKPITNSRELADAILSYNTKFKKTWKFKTLHKLFEEYLEEDESQYFFSVTLPEIAKLALALPKLIQTPIPLLKQHKNRSVSLSQQQISSLLANAFFCTFPRRNSTKKAAEYASYPDINFSSLYESWGSESTMEKLKCICHYFRRVCTKVPTGVMTFSRRSVPPRLCPQWAACDATVGSLPVHVDSNNTIEDASGLIQVDFANKYLGGGVLGNGCVQEEIRFVICPELMISMLFTEVLRPYEALLMIGCERYSTYSGYGSSFHWAGDYKDGTPLDSSHRRRCAVLAVDAAPYATTEHEYQREMITRDLNKAWVGFTFYSESDPTSLQYPGVATGNWGCGAFGGSPHLKSLIQLMACVLARRPMAYYTFGDVELRDDIVNVYNLLARYHVTVGQLYKYILRFSCTDVRKTQLHPFLHQVLRDEENNKLSTHVPEDMSLMKNTSPIDESEVMDISDSIEAAFQTEFSENLLKDTTEGSPDLFSQDSDKGQKETKSEVHANKETSKNESAQSSGKNTSSNANNMTPNVNKMAANSSQTSRLFDKLQKFDEDNGQLNFNSPQTKHLIDKMTPYENKMADSENKMAVSENKMAANTSRLFDKMQKLDEDNERLNFHSQHTTLLNNKMAVSENKMAPNTSRLFDEMQKLDENNGRLNLNSPHTKHLNQSVTDVTLDSPNVTLNTSNITLDSDRLQMDISLEAKKKLSRKITDYFSKKPV